MEADLDRGLARVPLLIAAIGLVGAGVAWRMGGLPYATAFLTGAVAAYFNFRLLERFVGRLLERMAAEPANRPKAPGARLFIQLAVFVLVAFVIIRLSGFNVVVALCGFLACPAAVTVEMLYQLFN